jgi:Rrf2 family protein
MRVSARADYALRAAIELAAAPGSHVTMEQLARAQNIPGTFIETIVTQLRRTGLVRSQRGPDGGCWLARPASGISLADVIRAIDGQFPGARGEPPEDVTYPGPAEPLRRVWIALRAFGPAVLETLTLADIVSGELWLPCRPGREAEDPGGVVAQQGGVGQAEVLELGEAAFRRDEREVAPPYELAGQPAFQLADDLGRYPLR